jgi:hypothetical protein
MRLLGERRGKPASQKTEQSSGVFHSHVRIPYRLSWHQAGCARIKPGTPQLSNAHKAITLPGGSAGKPAPAADCRPVQGRLMLRTKQPTCNVSYLCCTKRALDFRGVASAARMPARANDFSMFRRTLAVGAAILRSLVSGTGTSGVRAFIPGFSHRLSIPRRLDFSSPMRAWRIRCRIQIKGWR